MAKLLVRVAKSQDIREIVFPEAPIRHQFPSGINPRHLGEDDDYRDLEFFEIDERDKDILVDSLTRRNAGVEVQVFMKIEESIRPAGDLVTKKVTKDGVLPA